MINTFIIYISFSYDTVVTSFVSFQNFYMFESVMTVRGAFPHRLFPNSKSFVHLHGQLCETGYFLVCLSDDIRARTTKTADVKRQILDMVVDQQHASTRAVEYISMSILIKIQRVLNYKMETLQSQRLFPIMHSKMIFFFFFSAIITS